MKYDEAWVTRTAQCPDGMGWGLKYVKDGGKDLGQALPGFERADFLLWFLVKTELLSIEGAFDLLTEICKEWFNFKDTEILLLGVGIVTDQARKDAVDEANVQMLLKHFHHGHELTAVAFMARMVRRVREGDDDEALKDGQCVLNNIVAARTGSLNFEMAHAQYEHKTLCNWLRARVIVGVGK